MASPEHIDGDCHVSATSHIHISVSLHSRGIYLFHNLRGMSPFQRLQLQMLSLLCQRYGTADIILWHSLGLTWS